MNYIKHYEIDNEIIDYNTISSYQKDLMEYRFSIILRELKQYNNKGNILDIGTGNGYLSKKIKNYYSLDISQTNNLTNSIKIEGDAQSLPIKKNSFNTVILSEVLEHLNDPEKTIVEINNILINKGVLILTVPYKEKIKKHLCIHCNKLTPENAHLHSFDENVLKELLEKNKFKILKIILFENKILTILHFFSIFKRCPLRIKKNCDTIAKIFRKKYNKILIIAEKGR